MTASLVLGLLEAPLEHYLYANYNEKSGHIQLHDVKGRRSGAATNDRVTSLLAMAEKNTERPRFRIANQKSSNSRGGIIDVLHLAIFRDFTPAELVASFEEKWKAPPEAVSLPIVHPDGLLFDVEGVDGPKSDVRSDFKGNLDSLADIAKEFANLGLGSYLLLEPGLNFLASTGTAQIVDIVGDTSRQLCFCSDYTQAVAAALLGTAVWEINQVCSGLNKSVEGLVIDMVDLFPMGGEAGRIVEVTCFCGECMAWFEQIDATFAKRLKDYPGPMDVLLRATETGVAHIDELRASWTAADVVRACRRKGFDSSPPLAGFPETVLLERANTAVDYLAARHKQLLVGVKRIFEESLSNHPQLKRILLTGGAPFDATSCIVLERLDLESSLARPYDELWFDYVGTAPRIQKTPWRAYLSQRSRYFLDHLIETLVNVTSTKAHKTSVIGSLQIAELRTMLQKRCRQALAAIVNNPTALTGLPPLDDGSTRIGFVAPAFWEEYAEKLINAANIPSHAGI